MPTAMQKLRAFSPQIVMATASATFGTSAPYLFAAGLKPFGGLFGVLSFVLGVAAFFTAIDKHSHAEVYGWQTIVPDGKCKHCKKLEARYADLKRDRDELRDALVILQLPESRS